MLSAKKLILLVIPTNAQGIDQNTVISAVAVMMPVRRTIRSHHRIRSENQMISYGRTPMYRCDMCDGR